VTSTDDVYHDDLRRQFDAFLDEHRQELHDSLTGLTEEQARRRLVPSSTTMLGLLKHATFVEQVWFNEAVTRRSRSELGIPTDAQESFLLTDDDTIDSVRSTYRSTCAQSRYAIADFGLDERITGNGRGPLPVRWVYLHVLRELAQHCGHADILREQLLSTNP
jgi:Protein of unknown function (DUF664)